MFQKKGTPNHNEELVMLISNAGYSQATRLQSVVVPLIIQGKSLIVETNGTEGKTASFFLPFLIKHNDKAKGISTLILTSNRESLTKVASHYKRFTTRISRGPRTVFLGIDESPRDELKNLGQNPHLIIGTSDRIIDHIRRNNLDLSGVKHVMVDLPGGSESGTLDRDLQFILSKIRKTPQIVLFPPTLKDAMTLETSIGRHQILTTDQLCDHKQSVTALNFSDSTDRLSAAVSALELYGSQGAMVIAGSKVKLSEIEKNLKSLGLPAKRLSSPQTVLPGTLVLSEKLSPEAEKTSASAILFCDPDSYPGPERAVLGKQIFLLHSAEEEKSILRIEEKSGTPMKKESLPKNDEMLQAKLKELVKIIKEDADPVELNNYRKVIKKNVPLHLRGYLTAYLLMNNKGRMPASRRAPKPTIAGPTKTLFVSIGKNRKVFPKDLVKLFATTLKTEPQNIGATRVLDNYSFVEISEKLADKAIAALDGTEYRGRKITVNYAKKR